MIYSLSLNSYQHYCFRVFPRFLVIIIPEHDPEPCAIYYGHILEFVQCRGWRFDSQARRASASFKPRPRARADETF